jgi:hypothetical protein
MHTLHQNKWVEHSPTRRDRSSGSAQNARRGARSRGCLQPALPPRPKFGIKLAGQPRDQASGERRAAKLLGYFLDLPGRDSLYLPISISAKVRAFS